MKKIVVAVTGASGSIYAGRLLTKLEAMNDQVSSVGLIFSANAEEIWLQERGSRPSFTNPMIRTFAKNDFMAPFASGSAVWDAMVVIPASMGIIGRIAHGVSDDLITRAADVFLKERKKLIVVPRETPYSLIHLKNMVTLTEAGAVILAASPSFYHNPQTPDEIADTVVNRIIDHLGLDSRYRRWGEPER